MMLKIGSYEVITEHLQCVALTCTFCEDLGKQFMMQFNYENNANLTQN